MAVTIGTAVSVAFGIKRLFASMGDGKGRPARNDAQDADAVEADLLESIEEAVLVAQRAGKKWARSGADRRELAAELIEHPVRVYLKHHNIDLPGRDEIRPILETIAGGVYDLLVVKYGDKVRNPEG